MIQFKAKTDDGKTKNIEIPSCWEEVDVNLFVELYSIDATDPVAVFSVLSGIPYDKLSQLDDNGFEGDIFKGINWFYQEFDFSKLQMPSHVIIEGRAIEIPKKIEK